MFGFDFKTSCYDIWRKEQKTKKIITRCKALDTHLHGGISPNIITEFCGAPGVGKTEMCMQLSVTVQIPTETGGPGGKAIYVDTNQNFQPARVEEMAVNMEKQFQKILLDTQSCTPDSQMRTKAVLDDIYYIYCADYSELLATVITFRQFLLQDPEIKLIIIDSFSSPLRRIDDVSERTNVINELFIYLRQIALEFEIAVVITNQLTSRHLGNKNFQIAPCLGDSHLHNINQRILLTKSLNVDTHVASVEKCIYATKEEFPFSITKSGIRGF